MHIDWSTLALQTVNFLILVWLLTRFFFRPVAAIIAERQRRADVVLSDADAARKAADAARDDAGRLRAQVDAERGRLLNEAREAERTAREAMLAKAREEAMTLRSDAEAAIARDRAAADAAATDYAGDLAIDIARRLLERLPRGLARGAFLAGLVERLQVLPAEARSGLAAAGQPLEIVTDAALSDDEKAQVEVALAAALGAAPAVVFRCDAALLAGIELHSRNVALRNSWRADLDRLQGELDRERQPSDA